MAKAKVEEETEKVVIEEKPEQIKPTDPGWQDYVLSHLEPDEVTNGNPTTDGLRRIAPIVLGHGVQGTAHVVQAPNKNNGMVATVEYTVSIPQMNGIIYNQALYTDCADASPENCNPPFSLHPTAMASTRAEGRALRKLLKLKKIATAEELDTPRDTKQENGDPLFMNYSQFSVLNTLFKQNNLNGLKYINKYTEKYHSNKFSMVGQIPYTIAKELIQHVQKWSRGKNPEDLPMPPEDVQGYDESFASEWNK